MSTFFTVTLDHWAMGGLASAIVFALLMKYVTLLLLNGMSSRWIELTRQEALVHAEYLQYVLLTAGMSLQNAMHFVYLSNSHPVALFSPPHRT